MIRNIDRVNDKVVQKIVSPYGKTLRYQYGIPGKGMTEVSTLAEARRAIGKFHAVILKDDSRPKITLASG